LARWKFLFSEEEKWYTEAHTLAAAKHGLLHIYWSITNRCQLDCAFCYARNQRELGPELSKKEIKSIIDGLPDETSIITFTGGEPLGWRAHDLLEIAEFASGKDIKISLSTAGPAAINRIEMMEKAGIRRIQFSLDGITPQTHNGIRHPRNTFHDTLKAIRQAVNSSLRVSVCTTIRERNIKEVLAIYEYMKILGVHEYRLMRLIPISQRREEYRHLAVPTNKYTEFLQKIVERVILDNKYRSEPIRIETDEPYYFVKALEDTIDQKILRYHPCDQGKAICSIAADGKITPCPIANGTSCIAGDVRTQKLQDVWQESEVFKLFRDPSLIDGCRKCKYRETCGAGCRCAAFGYFGNLDSPDPICPLSIKNSTRYRREDFLLEHVELAPS